MPPFPEGEFLYRKHLQMKLTRDPGLLCFASFFFYLSTRSVLSLRNETHDKSSNTELHTCLFH